ncbi:hypothetical protein Bca4012_063128 [Brassica carinata]
MGKGYETMDGDGDGREDVVSDLTTGGGDDITGGIPTNRLHIVLHIYNIIEQKKNKRNHLL